MKTARLAYRIPLRLSPCLAAGLVLLATGLTHGQTGYRKPPQNVLDVLNAPPTPTVSVSPTRDRLLLIQGVRYPSIAEVAEPMLRLAGLRINPRTNGPHRAPRVVGFTLLSIADAREQAVVVPKDAHLGPPSWSPDGRHFAFTHTTPAGVELWVGDTESGQSHRLEGLVLNAAYGTAFQWMPDSQHLLCQTIVAGRGRPPAAPRVPQGPTIQESRGKTGPVRTFEDLLRTQHDEDLFDYYATSQLVRADRETGQHTPVGKPARFSSVVPAPDGRHLLVVRIHRPYSYLYPAFAFPREVDVWDTTGKPVVHLASLPLADQVPIDGVPTGPRSHQWLPTEAATLVWVEALDNGDPRKKVPQRDRVLAWSAPFPDRPVELARTVHRFAGLVCDEKGEFALLSEYDRDRRWQRTYLLQLREPGATPRLVWDRSVRDRYHNPGRPLLRSLPNGHAAIARHGASIFLAGQGATPRGDRPFLDLLDLTTLETQRLFRCDDRSLESVVALLSEDGLRFLTRYETVTEPPNYCVRTAGDPGRKPLTHFADPTPQLRGIKKQLVTYRRADGVPLSFTLYLPPDYQPGRRVPTVVWAYPLEFNDAATAGQVSASPNRFTTIAGPSHLFFLLQGYAVLDGATMPVIGDPETVNNTYLEQIVASARAAIDKAVELGVTDRNRVGVGGHSYGAFMTANLLAHCDLFQAGIARSGAYNRTLTPFGFQSERRTLWQARDMYLKVSPFLYADRIKKPLLLIHGEADDNSGTFPIQSERMYQAIRGNGGTVRFVQLPAEAHGYQARESIEHTLYEMIAWFDRYVKNVPEATGRQDTNGKAGKARLGIFEGHADVGTVLHPGSAHYDERTRQYTVTGSGENMWFARDAFHFAWKKVNGDVALAADVAFVGKGTQPHRKACLMIRQSLDADAAYVDVAVHGDGLTSLQFRAARGEATHEVQANVKSPARVRLVKRGQYALLYLAAPGEELRFSGAAVRLAFDAPVLAGLGVCAHQKDEVETVRFSNVELVSPLPPSAKASVLYSTLETLALPSTDRRVVYVTPTRIEAPNWLRDGKTLIYNSRGRIHRIPAAGGEPEVIDTGFATRCNNDHGVSPDGTRLVISDQSQGDRKSRIYTLPLTGGTPQLVTPAGPSYWHGWSPDGKTLVYCGERDGEFDVYAVPVGGGQETRLTTAKGLDDGPEYAPDGRHICFNSDRTGRMQLWRMKADGTDQEQLTDDDYQNWFPHPSPDGRSLVFLSYEKVVTGHPADKDVTLRRMNLADRRIDVLARFLGGQGTINVPCWSPDGRRIAFVTYQRIP